MVKGGVFFTPYTIIAQAWGSTIAIQNYFLICLLECILLLPDLWRHCEILDVYVLFSVKIFFIRKQIVVIFSGKWEIIKYVYVYDM